MIAIDFFCGAGGLSKGLALSGINVLAGIDNNILCRDTYNNNNAPSRFVHADMKEYMPENLLALFPQLNDVNRDDLLLAGCAPCQPFSQANKSEERSPDATLLSQFGRFVEFFLPGQVMIENVPGIARVKGNSTFKRFIRLLERNGYSVVYKPTNAKYFGVPQNRVRLLVIATRGITAKFPVQTHANKPKNNQNRLVTVRNVIEHFPPLQAGQQSDEIPNHVAANLSQLNLERLRHTPHDGGGRRDWPKELCLRCHSGGYEGHTDVYGRMFWDKPSPTLTCKCQSISNGRYAHPEQDRAISLREAAAIQTFPDDYIFYGSNTSIAAQIGNAVPVLLGRVMGEHFQKIRLAIKM
jgi:DNA (cytosine-5-)-methyltransferase